MVMRLQLVEGEYRLILSAEAVETFQVKEGDPMEVQPARGAVRSEHRTVTMEEAMQAFGEIEPLHRNAFRELAK